MMMHEYHDNQEKYRDTFLDDDVQEKYRDTIHHDDER
jgi:hypothetical protein